VMTPQRNVCFWQILLQKSVEDNRAQ